MTTIDQGVGIDLGTSNSSICRLDVSRGTYDFAHAKDEAGTSTELPSLVAVFQDQMYFGHAAIRRERSPEAESLRNFKLLLRSNEPVLLGGREYQPVQLMHRFLSFLKQTYERQWGPLDKAVITVPALEDFDVDYLARLRAAVTGEGHAPLFTDFVTLKEPDAVLMSLIELDKLEGQKLVVFDMGGGTLDVSIREVTPNADDPKRPILKALAITGSKVAGVHLTIDFGAKLVQEWAAKAKITLEPPELQRIISTNFHAFDESKIALSGIGDREGLDSTVSDPFALDGGELGRSIHLEPRASDLTELSRPICEEALTTVKKALAEAGLEPYEIDKYIMVGGSSQLPMMKQMLLEFFGKEPLSYVSEFGRIDPQNAISKGAAVYDLDRPVTIGQRASSETSPSVPNTAPILEQILPYDLSLLVNGGEELRVLVPKGAVLPFGEISQTFYMPKTDDNIDIALYRGTGEPADAIPVARRTVWFPQSLSTNAEVDVKFSVAEDGAVTVYAQAKSGSPVLALVSDRLPD